MKKEKIKLKKIKKNSIFSNNISKKKFREKKCTMTLIFNYSIFTLSNLSLAVTFNVDDNARSMSHTLPWLEGITCMIDTVLCNA